jgi:PAS domain S-box-containing protein
VVLRDITTQKQAEEALQLAERKYRLIFEEALVGLYQSTPDGRVLSANPAMAHMYGLETPEEFVAYITDVQTQLYVEPTRRVEFKRLMAVQGGVRHFEVQVYRRDGSKMWLSLNGRAVRENDIIVRYEGSAEDITDRKHLEDQLRLAQEQYREIFDTAIGGMFQSTPEGRYLNVNPAMAKMLGYDSPQEVIETITNISLQVYVDPKRREELLRERDVARPVRSELGQAVLHHAQLGHTLLGHAVLDHAVRFQAVFPSLVRGVFRAPR